MTITENYCMCFNLILYNTIWLKRNTSSKLRVMVADSLKTLKSLGFATLDSWATCARVKLRGKLSSVPFLNESRT